MRVAKLYSCFFFLITTLQENWEASVFCQRQQLNSLSLLSKPTCSFGNEALFGFKVVLDVP